MERWKGKVAVVTGASAGIGSSISEALVKHGMIVIGLARRENKLQELSERLEGSKGKFHPFKADISQEVDILNAFSWIDKTFGGVHILVNNAALFEINHLADGLTENWKSIMDVNILGLTVCTREALKSMKAHNIDDGNIINIGSRTVRVNSPAPGWAMYTASKKAVQAITEGTRVELAKANSKIKVSMICPGLVKTDMVEMAGITLTPNTPYLTSENIAEIVVLCLQTPPSVQITDLEVLPVGEDLSNFIDHSDKSTLEASNLLALRVAKISKPHTIIENLILHAAADMVNNPIVGVAFNQGLKLVLFTGTEKSMDRWTSKIAVVTGASSGIGESVVEALVENGITVVGLARRYERLLAIAERLKGKKASMYPIKADITKEEQVKSAFEWIKRNLGGVDILINNAGISLKSYIIDGEMEKWQTMFNLNVLSLCSCTRETLNSIKDRNLDEGHIININSISGQRLTPRFGNMVYSSTKFAAKILTEGLRLELANKKSKIRVTSIHPGAVDTEIFEVGGWGKMPEKIGENILQPKAVANAVIYALTVPPEIDIADLTIRPTCDTY
ncbi:uncharacterized protein LOC142317921 [Lycorma delicatula]|uniref:uncharacterized protein LOC142317921 n=1 Tax=Lycorma delicatula TaxID=130591 RepID=UPI003F50FEEF